MLYIISSEIRNVVARIKFADNLDVHELMTVIDTLKEKLKDESNFDFIENQPLSFSKKGLNIIKKEYPPLAAKTFMEVIKNLDRSISLAPDKSVKLLSEALQRNRSWISTDIRAKEFDDAVQKAQAVLAHIDAAIAATLDLGKAYSLPEVERRVKTPTRKIPVIERGRRETDKLRGFNPFKRPPAVAPENFVERRKL